MGNFECALCDRPGTLEHGGYLYCERHFRTLFRVRWRLMQRRTSQGKQGRRVLPAH